VLEHLFEVDAIREQFDNWNEDQELRMAWLKAIEWSSWINRRRDSLIAVSVIAKARLNRLGYCDLSVEWTVAIDGLTIVMRLNDTTQRLIVTCDEAWVEAVRTGEVDLESFADFVADRANWRRIENATDQFSVKLRGDKIRARMHDGETQ
jgi:hypothetical protein